MNKSKFGLEDEVLYEFANRQGGHIKAWKAAGSDAVTYWDVATETYDDALKSCMDEKTFLKWIALLGWRQLN